MKKASDLMTPNPKMVGSEEPLQEVISLFLSQGITCSPVVTPAGKVLGVLSELALVKAYMLHKAKFTRADKVGHHQELIEPISYVDASAPLVVVLKEMISAPTHRLLVRDQKEKIVGVISPKDLMKAMLGGAAPQKNMKQKLLDTEEQLKESIQKLESLSKRLEVYQQAFHETPYMMHAVDSEGKIIMANKMEHEALGYQDGELIGKSILDIYSSEHHKEALMGLRRVMVTGHHHVTYSTLVKKNGGLLRCDLASSSLSDKDGKFLSTITVLRPVDEDEIMRILTGVVSEEGPLAEYANTKKEDPR